MHPNVREFIEKHIDIIESEDFTRLYDLAIVKLPNYEMRMGELTKVLLDADINPLNHMTSVPDYYYSEFETSEAPHVPNNITEIGEFAFFNCDFETITIPSSVKKVRTSAFDFCTSLKTVIIEEGLESIGGNCFTDCTSLSQITLPKSLKRLAGSVFNRCPNLTTLKYNGTLDEWYNIEYYPNTFNGSSLTTLVCTDRTVEI